MQYAEDFRLPDNQYIVTTRDHPFCPDLEPSFEVAMEHGIMKPYNNVDVAVICRDQMAQSPEEWTPDYDISTVVVRVRRVVFNVIDPEILDYRWQNGIICDKGLLHGFAVHRLYRIRPHRTCSVLGRHWGVEPEESGGLITSEGVASQNALLEARNRRLTDKDDLTWHRKFHEFLNSIKVV